MTVPEGDRFYGHPRLEGHVPAAGADTHGLPWEGRRVEAARFGDDLGDADPVVLAALAEWSTAVPERRTRAEVDAVRALAGSRVLVPLLAAPDADARQTQSAMATALLTGPDGSQALPVFTSATALAAWDASARPVPTPMAEACRAALEEGCQVMIVDLADRHAAVLRMSQLWALAAGERWTPAHEDPVVRLAVAEAAAGLEGLLSARCEDGVAVHPPGTLRLVLTMRPGLPAEAVDAVVGRVGERLAADPDVRRRIDDIAVIVRQCADPADAVPSEPPL